MATGTKAERRAVDLDVLFDSPRSRSARETIKAIRSAWGMTQKEFAHSLGVQPETVSRWETGKQGIQAPCAMCVRYLAMLRENGLASVELLGPNTSC